MVKFCHWIFDELHGLISPVLLSLAPILRDCSVFGPPQKKCYSQKIGWHYRYTDFLCDFPNQALLELWLVAEGMISEQCHL